MTGPMDLELLRLLRGELPPEDARRLRARLPREPELAAAYDRLERTWRSLEPPPPSPIPPGFSTRVMARVRASDPRRDSWASAPGWVRATAAAALVTGIAVGAGVGSLRPVAVPATGTAPAPEAAETPAAPAIPAATAPPETTPEAVPERSPEAKPAAPVIAGLTEEETGEPAEDGLFGGDGDLADSYWEAVASLSTTGTTETSETDEAGETGGAVP